MTTITKTVNFTRGRFFAKDGDITLYLVDTDSDFRVRGSLWVEVPGREPRIMEATAYANFAAQNGGVNDPSNA